MKNILSNGWFQASFMVLVLWGLINVTFRVSSAVLDVNYIIFTCCLFLSSSFALLLIGGKGGLGQETMRSVDTWIYGFVLLLLYILNLYLFGLVTSTEATLLQRLSIVVSLVIGWLFLGRKSNWIQVSGALTVLAGVLVICSGVAGESKEVLYAVIIISAILQAVQIFVAELHRPHKHAAEVQQSPKAKCRVVGFVMFVTSTLFLILAFLLALTQGIHADENLIMKDLPVLKDFLHTKTIVAGLIVGVVLVAPIKVLEFSSAHKINAHNFLAICCLAPVATLFWEWSTSPLTGLSLRSFTQLDMVIGVAVTIGGLVAAFGGMKGKSRSSDLEKYLVYTSQDLEAVEDSREIVANTLEHFNSDVKKASEALDMPVIAIEAFLEDKEKVIAFKNFAEVARAYRKRVAMADGLTGLANRSAFMTALKSAAYEVNVFSVLYLDLDKFKPVNDTYGHEAGDKILQGVADRLKKAFPMRSVITRMGGDEYCVLLLDADKVEAKTQAEHLKEIIATPFDIEGIKDQISIGSSIGIATYPEDGDSPEKLLATADAGMYGVKHSKD